jgi:hypothetical protein
MNKLTKIILSITGAGVVMAAGAGKLKNEVSADKVIAKFEQADQIKAKYSLQDGKVLKREVIKNAEKDKYKKEAKDKISVEIGNADKDEFTPDIALKRWDEVGFKIKPKLDGVKTKDKDIEFTGDKVKFKTPKMDFEFYEVADGDGAYKYVWYLNEKPASNVVNFGIETTGLNFFYQPPLTQEYQNGYSEEFKKEIVVSETEVKDLDGKVLVHRPIDVVGSYAVYHESKGVMVDKDGKDYKTGQAFMIYRPHLFDANGKESWGVLSIDAQAGTYSVEIPQEFLDSAIYPVRCE